MPATVVLMVLATSVWPLLLAHVYLQLRPQRDPEPAAALAS